MNEGDRAVKTDLTSTGETLEVRKSRIEGVWSAWEEIQKHPDLVSLFDRQAEFVSQQEPSVLLAEYGYPPRTKISDLSFETWKQAINPKFIKDGYVYLLRGDHPNLEKKGFYTRPYAYAKKTTMDLTRDLRSSEEVGYYLYQNEAYLKTAKPSTDSIAQELAYKQSQRGGSSFVSGTTNLDTAVAGTGNQPDQTEQSQYEIYVIKVPLGEVINSDTGNSFGHKEDELLIPDFVAPDEIIAKFPRKDREGVYQYLHKLLGINREDLGMTA